jgi:excisionase family DNA binding protein
MPSIQHVLSVFRPKVLLPLVDVLLVNIATLAGLWLWAVRDDFRHFDAAFVFSRTHWFLAISASWLLLAVVQDLYHPTAIQALIPSLWTLLGMTGLLLVLYFAVYFFAPRDNTLPRGVVVSIAGVSFLLVSLWRFLYITVTASRQDQNDPLAKSAANRDSNATSTEKPSMAEHNVLSDQVLTVQEVAERLKVSQATVWRWCQSGKLPAFRVGQQWRIRADDLQAVMHGNGKELES